MNRFSLILRGLSPTLLLLTATIGLSAQTTDVTTVSAADGSAIVAPDSIASSWGVNFTAGTAGAESLPLPTMLEGIGVSITDSAEAQANAGLYMVSPSQINLRVPAGAALGVGSVTVARPTGDRLGSIFISNVAPTLFTTNMMGTGRAAGQVLVVSGSTANLDEDLGSVAVGAAGTSSYLMLYGTGIRRHSANPVQALIDGIKVPVLYADAQGEFEGLDQINIGPLPAELAGNGTVDIELFVDGVPANVVSATFQ